MKAPEEKISELFRELVPSIGKAADTVAGEIIRAIARICHRYYNVGDHIGVGYGEETCNPAAKYLCAKCDDKVNRAIQAIWGEKVDSSYEAGLVALEKSVLEYIEEHPELRSKANSENMLWDYRNKMVLDSHGTVISIVNLIVVSKEDEEWDDYEDEEEW